MAKKEVSPFRAWADQPDKAAITELCQWIIEGEHLAGFCKSKSFAYVTVLDWIQTDKGDGGRAEMYAHAREDRGDVLADQIISIADEECTMVKRSKHQAGGDEEDDAEVEVVFDPTAVARNKLRVDARKWAASKLKPRIYGDKVETTHKGSVGVTLTASPADEAL